MASANGETIEEWRLAGRRIRLAVRGVPRNVFVRRVGEGPALVLLHGFPASSFEWVAIETELARHHEVITFDFLGYGASDKPPGHRYSVFEQADLTEAVIAECEVASPAIVAYDYGSIVLTELIARRFDMRQCIFLNSGLFASQYRPRLAQRMSLMPVLGALLSRVFTESMFAKTWGEVFSAEHPLTRGLAAVHYRALRENDPGHDIQRKLLQYIPERAAHAVRFEDALLHTEVPRSFLWGMSDPVSGRLIARELRHRIPGADLVEYADAGHCPHIEIPDRVVADILRRTAR